MSKYNILFLLIFLSSCITEKKAHKFLDNNPEFSAKECAVRFPINETVDTVTVLDTSMFKAHEMEFSYLYHIIDSLLGDKVPDSVKREAITIIQEKKVPVVKYKYIIRTQENTAKLKSAIDSCSLVSKGLQGKLDTASSSLIQAVQSSNKYRSERNRLYWWIILLLVLLFRKPIISLIRKAIIKF